MAKSELNKTIELTEEEVSSYLSSQNPNILLGDMLEKVESVPDGSIDLLLTDPPYNLSKNFGKVVFKKLDRASYYDYTREWLEPCVKKLKSNASVYICCDWKCSGEVQRAMEECGITVLNRITWKRDKGRGATKNFKNVSEDIWFGVMDKKDYYFDLESVKVRKSVICPYTNKDGSKRDWTVDEDGNAFRMTCPPNVWTDIVIPFWSMPENTTHPTQKPESLLSRLISASCPVGGKVFDPFAGSGSTLVTAHKMGRDFIGIEIDPYWCAVADYRIKNKI